MSQTVGVDLHERSYSIQIGSGSLDQVGGQLASGSTASRAMIITDDTVGPLYQERVVASLARVQITSHTISVAAGEPSKATEVAIRLWEELLGAGADRRSVVVALGGGVIGDLAGFVAATFARGIRLLQVPTTLLAQVDSSVGGKVGINLRHAKNMVGAFWQPMGVVIDTDVLQTLSDRHYRAGLAEVIKYGVILDEDFFVFLEGHVDALQQRNPDILQTVIARCCRLKADVVEQDEREETGRRAVLNYGHTFCHALEAATDYDTFLHGEAVAIGMLCASRLAQRLGRVNAHFTQRQFDLLSAVGLPTQTPEISPDELLRLMSHDKKAQHGKLRFVLPTAMGHVELVGDVDADLVKAALKE